MILLIETTAFTQKSLFHLIIWKGSILLAYFLSVIQKEAMPLSGLNCGGMILGIKISKNHWNRSGFDLKGAALSELALASSGFGEDVFAVVAGNYSLGMTEDHSGLVAASAFDVHEIRVGSGHQALELVTLPFSFEGGVKQVSVHCCWLKILGIFYYLIIPLFFKSLNSFTNTQNSSHTALTLRLMQVRFKLKVNMRQVVYDTGDTVRLARRTFDFGLNVIVLCT